MDIKRPKYMFGLLETPSEFEMVKTKAVSSRSVSVAAHYTSSSRMKIQQHSPKGYSSANTPYASSSNQSNTACSSTLVAVVEGRGHAAGEIGIASIDLKQPVLILSQFSDSQSYTKTLAKLQLIDPLEIVLPSTLCEKRFNSKLFNLMIKQFPNIQISSIQRRYFNENKGFQYIKHVCAAEYRSVELQISTKYYCLAATAALLKYVEFIQNIIYAPNSLKAVFRGCEQSTLIDSTTVKNLELLQNVKDTTSQYTLFGILNYTKTLGGCRLLRSNILQPPRDEETIRLRQNVVMELSQKEEIFFKLQSVVSKFVDIGHIISICVQIPKQETVKRAESRLTCVILLKHVLQHVHSLTEILAKCENQLLQTYYKALEDPCFEILLCKINEVIDEGTHYHKGNLQQHAQKCMAVKSQINGLLDVARRTYSELVDDLESYIRQLADSYKLPLRTAYSSLRGFHVQMSAAATGKDFRGDGVLTVKEKLPSIFIKVSKFKSTFSFTTMDLIKLNERMKTALDEIYRMADIVVTGLLAQVHEHIGCLYKLSDIVAMTDMLLAFTTAATLSSYVCPEFTDTLAIKQGIHPILQKISTETIVPNDTYASEDSNFVIITGPNMGGKSTYLKQIALLQIMAQIGCFVPAQYASFQIVHQIFSRVGTDDDMESNSSTFTLEMKETSCILQNASDKSIIIIDELGRGTSAEEGVGISWAIAEQLLNTKAYTFFVTHFMQLTVLKKYHPNVAYYYFEVQRSFNLEANCEKISYTHTLSRGVTPQTHYGLQLAEISAMPFFVISDARQIAKRIESQNKDYETRDSQVIKQHAVFNLATRLIQAGKNSRMDEDSLRVYLKSVHSSYIAEMQSNYELS